MTQKSANRVSVSSPANRPSSSGSSSDESLRSTDKSNLDRYFGELSGFSLMTREDEVDAAEEVLQSELGYWRALLSEPAALAVVAGVLEPALSEHPEPRESLRALGSMSAASAATDASARDGAVRKLAAALRALDTERSWVREVDAAVHGLGEDPDRTTVSPRYLERVDCARQRQLRAKHHFVAANLRLVIAVARRYNKGQLPLIDLIQEGNIGLMKAVERFDHTRGFRFSTYASWWIRHAVTRAIADKGRVVRIPVRVLETQRQVARTVQRLAAKHGETPSTAELAEETGLPESRLSSIGGHAASRALSLDRPVGDADGQTFVDLLANEEQPSPYEDVVTTEWSRELDRLLESLTPIEAQVLRLRFGLGMQEELTLKTIGDRFQLSRERIRQIQQQALGKMRRQMEA